MNTEHKVKVSLIWIDQKEGRGLSQRRTPYKWKGECSCGWGCLSWSWWRRYDMEHSGLTPEQWQKENGANLDSGAFLMALDHVGLSPL